MAFSRRLLDDGEQVAVAVRPHWWCFAPAGAGLAGALILAVGSVTYALPEPVLLVVVVLTLAALGRFVARYAHWATTRVVVTSERVIHRRGVVARRATEIPLGQVRGVSCRRSLAGRVLRCGEVVIETAEGSEHRLERLPRPAVFREEVRAAAEAHRRRWGWSDVDQLERLDDLCRRGVLTRAEFDRKKGQLLERM
ncbi:MAG TPA: PH domain-containing protein [Acidimicrobiales bacterium]|nr:PH domain-containing protein [Acidimicrobiales bacterium]